MRNPADRPMVAVIMVNWNGWRLTVEAYRSLKDCAYPNLKIIIVENGSTDDSWDELSRGAPDAELVRSDRNRGFAGGCNLGFEAARQAGAEYVYLLNNDAQVTRDAIGVLVDTSRELADAAVLGSVIRVSGSDVMQYFGSRKSRMWSRPEDYRYPRDEALLERELIESAYIHGAAMFFPAGMLQTVGVFDERFFLNFEETDWCYRARSRGARCVVTTRSVVYHASSASLGPYDAPLQSYFIFRNQLLFAESWAGFLGWAWDCLYILGFAAKRVARDLIKGAGGRLLSHSTVSLLLGVRDYFLRRFGDCPPIVRELARKDKEARLAAAS